MKKFSMLVAMVLVAVMLVACSKTYTVSFETFGGSKIDSILISDSELLEKPADPIRDNHNFAGWYVIIDGIEHDYAFNGIVTRDVTIYARWSIYQYVVSFETFGGSKIEPKTISHDQLVTKPADPTLKNHSFAGWYIVDNDVEKEYTFSEKVTKNVTINARWQINQHTVTFETFGGDLIDSVKVNYDELLSEVNAVKENYDFKGWFLDQAYQERFDFNTRITKDLTLYALYDINGKSVLSQFKGTTYNGTIKYLNSFNFEQTIPSILGNNGLYYDVNKVTSGSGINEVIVKDGELFINDTTTDNWTNAYLIKPQTFGIISIYTKMRMSTNAANWSLLNVFDLNGYQVFSLRTNAQGLISYAFDGDNCPTNPVVDPLSYTPLEEIEIYLEINTITGKVSFCVTTGGQTMQTTTPIDVRPFEFWMIRFLTASAIRQVYVDDLILGYESFTLEQIKATLKLEVDQVMSLVKSEDYDPYNYSQISDYYQDFLYHLDYHSLPTILTLLTHDTIGYILAVPKI